MKQVNTSTESTHSQYNCTSNDPKLKQVMLNANFVEYPEEHFGEEQTTHLIPREIVLLFKQVERFKSFSADPR